MSYEIDRIKEIDCPCGKGKIQQILESNDWNQLRETIEILCLECKENYEIESEYFCPKPKHDYTIYYCKSKKNGQKIKLNL